MALLKYWVNDDASVFLTVLTQPLYSHQCGPYTDSGF